MTSKDRPTDLKVDWRDMHYLALVKHQPQREYSNDHRRRIEYMRHSSRLADIVVYKSSLLDVFALLDDGPPDISPLAIDVGEAPGLIGSPAIVDALNVSLNHLVVALRHLWQPALFHPWVFYLGQRDES